MDGNLSFKTKVLVSLSLASLIRRNKELPLPFWVLESCFPGMSHWELLNTISKLESDGMINMLFVGKTKYLSILEKGIERLQSRAKFINFLREKWDGKFRLVLFDIPESDRKIRDQFRTILGEEGFVCWQRSVFVTTHLIEEKILREARKLGISKDVNVMLVDSPIGIDRERWVWDLWNLWTINDGYNLFITRVRSLLEERISNYKKWVLECQELRFSYYNLLCNEPFLSCELVGKNYLFDQAEESYESIGKKLLKVLERF